MALEYNLVSTREGQRLRLIAPERGLLYLGAETAERYLPDAGEEPATVHNPLLPPDLDQADSSEPEESAASASEKKSSRRWIIGGAAAAVVLIAAAAGIFLFMGREEAEPVSGSEFGFFGGELRGVGGQLGRGTSQL